MIGWLILISIIIALVFGWEFMTQMWLDGFDWINRLGEAVIERVEKRP